MKQYRKQTTAIKYQATTHIRRIEEQKDWKDIGVSVIGLNWYT